MILNIRFGLVKLKVNSSSSIQTLGFTCVRGDSNQSCQSQLSQTVLLYLGRKGQDQWQECSVSCSQAPIHGKKNVDQNMTC